MTIKLLSERLLKNDEALTWLSLTNNEIGIPLPELSRALLQNNTLRKVSCHAGFLASLTEEDLALLLETLSQLSHLQDLWLALPSRQAWRSSHVLNTILGSPHMSGLQKLTLRGMDDNGCHVLADALRKPDCKLTDVQIRGTTTTISNNNNTSANPAMSSYLPSKASRLGILAIADVLRVNQTLERLDLCYKGLDTESCRAIAKAVAVNQKLQKLDLSTPGNNQQRDATTTKGKGHLSQGMELLSQAMRQNFTLHNLNTPAEGDTKTMMDLFTKLNRTGSRAVMRNATDHTGLEDVLEVLHDNGKDITALYEILALNPALWDPAKANVRGLRTMEDEKENVPKKFVDTRNPADPIHGNAHLNINKRQKKLKPVMARWNENIFSTQEREKIKNFKKWTPTIMDHPVVQPKRRSAPAAVVSVAAVPKEVASTDSVSNAAAVNNQAKKKQAVRLSVETPAASSPTLNRRPWKAKSFSGLASSPDAGSQKPAPHAKKKPAFVAESRKQPVAVQKQATIAKKPTLLTASKKQPARREPEHASEECAVKLKPPPNSKLAAKPNSSTTTGASWLKKKSVAPSTRKRLVTAQKSKAPCTSENSLKPKSAPNSMPSHVAAAQPAKRDSDPNTKKPAAWFHRKHSDSQHAPKHEYSWWKKSPPQASNPSPKAGDTKKKPASTKEKARNQEPRSCSPTSPPFMDVGQLEVKRSKHRKKVSVSSPARQLAASHQVRGSTPEKDSGELDHPANMGTLSQRSPPKRKAKMLALWPGKKTDVSRFIPNHASGEVSSKKKPPQMPRTKAGAPTPHGAQKLLSTSSSSSKATLITRSKASNIDAARSKGAVRNSAPPNSKSKPDGISGPLVTHSKKNTSRKQTYTHQQTATTPSDRWRGRGLREKSESQDSKQVPCTDDKLLFDVARRKIDPAVSSLRRRVKLRLPSWPLMRPREEHQRKNREKIRQTSLP